MPSTNPRNGGVLPWSIFSSVLAQINPQTISSNYGSSDYDARHQLSASYIYELPFKSANRLTNLAIGGWQVSGTFFYRTGFPFSVVDSATVAGLTSQNLGGVTNPGPSIILQPLFNNRNFSNGGACVAAPCFGIVAGPNPALPGQAAINPGAPFQFQNPFFTNSFTRGAVVGRNAFTGPGFLDGDISLRKNFRINERFVFQLGLNAYNWFNHANYGTPYSQTNFGPSNFGEDHLLNVGAANLSLRRVRAAAKTDKENGPDSEAKLNF